ncbi:flagellar hook-associated protein FlgK [Lacrimispora sp. JR3]|uniref:flagellar hook-associated protein FlgK n=1 Tax=Lacrimispora sinapis TaxID=3111456 RepID=UPI003748A7FA
MTRSTFAGFTTARLAMAASQRSLDVTGQNIANINTVGYTKQQVDLVSLNLQGGDLYGNDPSSKIGYGVETKGISQIRDPFLDIQYRNQVAKVGTADARQSALNQLADIFDETNREALKKALSDLNSNLDKLSSNANNSEFDSIVRSSTQVLLSYIHQKATDLKSVREDTISSLEKTSIPTVNGLLSDIGKLNDSIWKNQLLGNPALEMLDQRNSKLDELASYLPISVSYKEVAISTGEKYNYPVVKFTGSDGVSYDLTGGEHGENFASLSIDRNKDAKGNEDGTVSISLIPASDFPTSDDISLIKTDITSYLKEGTIKGTVDMLNKSGELDNPATDFRGIGYYEKAFDSFVQTFANTFNKLNENTVPDTGVREMPSTGSAKSVTINGEEKAEYSISFEKSTGNIIKFEHISIDGQKYMFGSGNGDGTVAVGKDLEESLNNLAKELNETKKSLTVNGQSMEGVWAFNATTKKLTWTSASLPSGTVIESDSIKGSDNKDLKLLYEANPSNIKDYDLFKTSDGSRTFTAGNIKISDDWMNNNIHIIASHDPKAGSKDNSNILLMKKALTDSRQFTYEYTYLDQSGKSQVGSISYYTGSFSQCYSNMENMQGVDSKENSSILNNQITVLNQTSNNKDSVSGVSLDEEGINLMQYQRSYTAAARLMTTLDQALDVLINNTGVVGR